MTDISTNEKLHVSTNKPTAKNIYAIMLALIAWFAIVLQLVLINGSIINFFSYFTILCNLLVAISLTFLLFGSSSVIRSFFSRPSVQSAIALYIIIVGLVYNTLLRGILVLEDWQLLADNLLHVIIPVLYLVYWLIFSPKGILKYKDSIHWIYFPLIYLIYSLIRGSYTGWYPYPFLNVIKLGYEKVFLNIVMMIVVFLVAGLLLIVINRLQKNKLSG